MEKMVQLCARGSIEVFWGDIFVPKVRSSDCEKFMHSFLPNDLQVKNGLNYCRLHRIFKFIQIEFWELSGNSISPKNLIINLLMKFHVTSVALSINNRDSGRGVIARQAETRVE